ncbi:MAG: Asp-tRNA(Asn)/Glu-tRNA(Gln) amidotransferase subunit GatC [Candidatus Omnitrophota bacterium]
MITKKDVEYVSKLARIGLDEAEIEGLAKQLEAILEYIGKLNELDISKVEPTSHVLPIKNVYREDELKKSLPVDEVMKIASVRDKNQFKVPKVIE